MNTGNTYYFIDDFNNIRKQKNGVKSECSEVLELQDLIDDVNNLVDENEQLKKENEKLESLWEDKCLRDYMKFVGENALQEMHNEKYGDK